MLCYVAMVNYTPHSMSLPCTTFVCISKLFPADETVTENIFTIYNVINIFSAITNKFHA